MDAPKTPKPPATTGPSSGSRIQDRLAEAAQKRPDGGRLKTLVYLALGGTVVTIAVLQILGVLENPVARKVREAKEKRGEIPKSKDEPPKPPATMDDDYGM